MRHETFIGFAKKLAETTGRSQGLNITFGGQVAFTDGRQINLPSLPPGTVLSPTEARVLEGYVDHEAAHCRHTDFKVMKQLDKDPHKVELHHLWNILEDIRIENAHIQTYPGVRPFLDDLARHVDEEARDLIAEEKKAGKEPPFHSILYYHVYKHYRNIDTFIFDKDLSDYPKWATQWKMVDSRLPACRSSQEALNLARDLFKSLPREEQLRMKAPSFDGHEARGGAALDVLLAVMDKNDDLETKKGPGQPKDGQGKGKPTIVIKAKPGDDDQSSQHRYRNTGKSWYPPETTKNDRIFEPSRTNMGQYHATRGMVSAEISATKKMLNLYLRSRRRRAWSRGLEKGKLDATRLPQLLITQEKRVMKERREIQRVNTAVELLVDLSSSMNNETTRQAAILIAEALADIKGISLEVVGFTTRSGLNNYQYGTNKKGVGRLDAMDLLIYKGFDQPYLKARGTLGALQTSGSTPLAEAYGYSLERILTRDEPRRLLWIISDGDPAIMAGDPDHNDYVLMSRLHTKAKKLGIETAGMFIGHGESRLKKYVDKLVSVSSAQAFPRALLDMTKEQLA